MIPGLLGENNSVQVVAVPHRILEVVPELGEGCSYFGEEGVLAVEGCCSLVAERNELVGVEERILDQLAEQLEVSGSPVMVLDGGDVVLHTHHPHDDGRHPRGGGLVEALGDQRGYHCLLRKILLHLRKIFTSEAPAPRIVRSLCSLAVDV